MKLFIFIALVGCQMAWSQQNVRTVFVLRNSETVSSAANAPLSPAGRKRAECLAETLRNSGINHIFVSDVPATQQTAAPLAAALTIKPSLISARDTSTLVRDVLYSTGTAVVIADRLSLPVLLPRLEAGTAKPLGENEYDRLFVVTLVDGFGTPASSLRYCPAFSVPTGQPPLRQKQLARKPETR